MMTSQARFSQLKNTLTTLIEEIENSTLMEKVESATLSKSEALEVRMAFDLAITALDRAYALADHQADLEYLSEKQAYLCEKREALKRYSSQLFLGSLRQ